MDLSDLKVGEPERLVAELEARLRKGPTVEHASTALCHELYKRCLTHGETSLVLSRMYLSMPFEALDAGSKTYVRDRRAGAEVSPNELFLTLIGTYGDMPGWCDRKRSRGHRAIALNRETVTKAPMLARCFQQIGFDLEVVLQGDETIHTEGVAKAFGLFHVEDARGSPYVPSQDEFVLPYGVHSVVGCGTMLPNGAVSLWIGFVRHPVALDAAVPMIPLMPAFWRFTHTLYRRRALFVGG